MSWKVTKPKGIYSLISLTNDEEGIDIQLGKINYEIRSKIGEAPEDAWDIEIGADLARDLAKCATPTRTGKIKLKTNNVKTTPKEEETDESKRQKANSKIDLLDVIYGIAEFK